VCAKTEMVLSVLLRCIFHKCLRLRAVSVRLAACLLFHPELTFSSAFSDALKNNAAQDERPALAIPSWIHTKYVLPVQTRVIEILATPAGRLWSKAPCSRAISLCQVFHRLHRCLDMDLTPLLELRGVKDLQTVLPISVHFERSNVWRQVQEQIVLVLSNQKIKDMDLPNLLISPAGNHLITNQNYVILLTTELKRLWGSGANASKPSTSDVMLGKEFTRISKHLVAALSSLAHEKFNDRGNLSVIAESLRNHFFSAVWSLIEGEQSVHELPETSKARAHSLLASDLQIRHLFELMLRLGILLARRQEVHISKCFSRDWLHMFSVLISCGVASLRRLAFALAALVVPHILPDIHGPSGEGHAQIDAAQVVLAVAIAEHLGMQATSTASLERSFENKVAMWLVSQIGSPSTVEVEAAACVSPWLGHRDTMLQALAWRSLRHLLFGPRQRRALAARPGGNTQESTVVTRALHAVNPHNTKVVKAIVYAEVLELLRVSLEVAAAEGEERQRAYVKQFMESGMLSHELLPKCLSSGYCGVQRAAVRLLYTLLAADHTLVYKVLIKAGLWPAVVDAVAVASTSETALDFATFMGDVAQLVGKAASRDPQMLLWLSNSTNMLACWRKAMQAVTTQADEALPLN